GVSVAPAYRALTAGGRPDPRVRATDVGRLAADQVTQLWNQQKYAALTTPIPIATGVEAQLILAEARGGQEAVAIVNQLRARTGVALPALTAAEASAIATTLLDERARELWLQGTRWYDLRRAQLPLQPASGTAYPKAGSYGTQRCWPLPDVERAANPNIGTA
ncbi:MAG: RagB/SusD family nutrient uptake outer membrane protein, partial [Gemmatirosa sp.]